MEFTSRNPRLISYGLTTKHCCNQLGLQKTLWRERQYNHQRETVEEKAVFQNKYMKYLKTKVFYKLLLNTVHKKGDLKEKPSKCGTWEKQVMEIQIKPTNKFSDLLASIWNKRWQNHTIKIKIKWLFLENRDAEYDDRIYWHAYIDNYF